MSTSLSVQPVSIAQPSLNPQPGVILQGLTLRNFQSVGNITQSIRLDHPWLTLVLGENLDVVNSRNGVGKSTLLVAISYVLYGKPIGKVKLGNLVNNINLKNMLVTLDFARDGVRYRIERGQSPAVLRLFNRSAPTTGQDPSSAPSNEAQGENKNTQREIELLFGMSHLLFQHIVAQNTTTIAFFRLELAKQREIIEELFGITQLSLRADALKTQIVASREQLRDCEATVRAESDANARIQASIDALVAKAVHWDQQQAQRISTLTETLAGQEAIDFAACLAQFDALDAWTAQANDIQASLGYIRQEKTGLVRTQQRLQTALTTHRANGVENIASKIGRMEAEIVRYEAEAGMTADDAVRQLRADEARFLAESASKLADATALEEEWTTLRAQIAHPDAHACATCGQDLAGTDHLATVLATLSTRADAVRGRKVALDRAADDLLRRAKAIGPQIEAILVAQDTRQAAARAQAATIRGEIVQVRAAALQAQADHGKAAQGLEDELAQAGTAIAALEDDLLALEAALADLGPRPQTQFSSRDAVWQRQQAGDTLARELATARSLENPHTAQAQTLTATLQVIDYGPLNEWAETLKHEEFLLKIISSRDSFVRRTIIDTKLSTLNRRLKFYLEALGLPHEVVFLSDLTCEIVLMGRDYDFEQLSRGEMNRVMLSLSWSFRDVWESLNNAINLVWVDENLDSGIDTAGAEAGVAVLTRMVGAGKSVFLISHRDELIGRVDQIMKVRKVDGFTSFEENSQP